MNQSIFPFASNDRRYLRWEDHIHDLTPVEQRNGLWYKREDYFAPLGYGSINGSKLRQLIHLIHNADPHGIVTGASVLSPQVSMTALVARHYDIPCTIVLGGTRPDTAARHENVKIATKAGADFVYTRVGYNPALQKAVADLHATDPYRNWYRLSYGITTPSESTPEEVTAFHSYGADQTGNIPDSVQHIAIPAGSCNSVVSVLYGIARRPPANLQTITLFGIGPTRIDFIQQRLTLIEQHTGLQLRNKFTYRYHHHPEREADHTTAGPIKLHHYDLHTTGFATYQDRFPWKQDGIEFHPTYEGKMLTYIHRHPDLFPHLLHRDGTALYWIVGSYPRATR